MNLTMQRAAALSSLVCIFLFWIGFWILAGFMPPPSPGQSAEEVARFFEEGKYSIRAGMIICMFAVALLAPWCAVITIQMRRIEGKHSILAFTQLALGAIFVLEFTYLIFFWETATFRPRSPELYQLLNDMSWIPFIGLTSTGALQAICFGLAVLSDKRTEPIFPRWFGYFNIFVAMIFLPGTLNVYFKDGPLAWDGLIAFYLVMLDFTIWAILVPFMLLKAIKHQELEEAAEAAQAASSNGHLGDSNGLAAELAEMRKELDRLTARSS